MSWLPLWISRKQALAEGFTHEGTHFGVPVWVQYDEAREVMGMVATKFGPAEIVVSIGVAFTQFCNWFRPPGEEFEFAFCIKPIEAP